MQNSQPEEDEVPKGVVLRDFDDFNSLRTNIFDGVKNAMVKSFPVDYGNVRLELHDVDYDNIDDVPISEQKKNLLENKYITKKLRGTLKLYDKTNDQLLEEKRLSLMRVPYLTNRGTFIHGGNEYATIMQSRLLPGVYTRRQANGELETQFNVKPGTGVGFRVGFEPETTQYRVKISQANLHMYSLMHDLGTPDEELEKAWGPEIFNANKAKYDARVFDKAYDRLVSNKQKKLDTSSEDKVRSVKAALDAAKIHSRVAQKNLPNMFDPKVASEWNAKWMGKQAAEKVIDDMEFNPDLEPSEIYESYITENAEIKSAADMSALMQARKHSAQAKEEYKRKTAIMAAALAKFPNEFIVDQDGAMSGVTHLPSGFRIHVPKEIIPKGVKRVFQDDEDEDVYGLHKGAADIVDLIPKSINAERDAADVYNESDKKFYTLPVKDIIEQIKGRDPEEIDISEIWGGAEDSPGFSEERLEKADTKHPIIIDSYSEGEGFKGGLVDGRHRKIKLTRQGETKAKVIKLNKEDIENLIKKFSKQAFTTGAASNRSDVSSEAPDKTEEFFPDLKPEQLIEEYNSLYGKVGPRLASMKSWPKDWIPESSGLGWLDWYVQYTNGKRTSDDAQQIKRWKLFKARQVPAFIKNPTPKRALMLRNWAIDPLKLIDDEEARSALSKSMEQYRANAWDKYNKSKQ
jgi:hypothetical protein